MQLNTNFRDFYDHAFDRTGPSFNRHDRNDMSRQEIFALLEGINHKTPRHGAVRDLVPRIYSEESPSWRQGDVVVYTDPYAHRGEGKLLMSAAQALDSHADHYAAEYIPALRKNRSVSYRYLQVGQCKWWLQYWSEHDWRSNVGEGGVKLVTEKVDGYDPTVRYPLWAIDFITLETGESFAIDFNTAPSLAPLADTVTPTEIVSLLKQAKDDGYWNGQ